jgi:hypothetical protein
MAVSLIQRSTRDDPQYYTYPQPTQRGEVQFHQCFTRISLWIGRLMVNRLKTGVSEQLNIDVAGL